MVLVDSHGGRSAASSPVVRLAALSVAFFAGATQAAPFTYNNTTSTTTAWSAGTNWTAVPVSDPATALTFSGNLGGVNVVSNNDIAGNFLLNQFNMLYARTSGAPTVTVSGSPLEFVNDGVTAPVLTLNTPGSTTPVVTVSNNIVLTNDLTLSATTLGTFSGVVSGSGNVRKTGAGTVVLSGPNTFVGALGIEGGIVRATTVANGGVASGIGQGTGASSVVLGGGTLQYIGAATGSTDRLLTLGNANSTSGAIDSSSTNGATLNALQFTNTGAIALGGIGARTLTFTGTHTAVGGGQATRTVANASTFTPAINDGVGEPTSVVKTGAGVWSLAGTSNYSGGTTISTGRLVAASPGSMGTGSVTVASGAQLVVSSNTATYNNPITISGIGPTLAGDTTVGLVPGALVILGGANVAGPITLAANARVSASTVYAGASTVGTISGKISGAYQLEVSPGGAASGGIITLTNTANDYSGGTLIGAGGTGSTSTMFLASGASNVVPNGVGKGGVTLNGISYLGTAGLRLNGFNETINGLNSTGWTGVQVVENDSTTAESTLTLGDADSSGRFLGTVRNSGTAGRQKLNVTKIGTGTQSLGRANGYTGVTRVENGVLEIDFGGAATSSGTALTNYLSSTSTLQLAGGTLRMKGREDQTAYSDVANVTSANPRTLTLPTVAGLSVGQFITVDGVLSSTYIQSISPATNGLFLSNTITAAIGARTISTDATSFTNEQTLASADLSASSTLDFGGTADMVLRLNAFTQSVDGTVLTIDNWIGTANTPGGIHQLRIGGNSSAVFTSLFAQNEVFFTDFGEGYEVHQFTGYFEVVPVPEPASMALLGLVGLGLLRRRRA